MTASKKHARFNGFYDEGAGHGQDLSEKVSGKNISFRAVEKQIRNLREKGQIVRVGADNGGHWEVKEK
ncbi:MAG: hypothetical protein K6E78_07880 [Treponema sp.]|nr:hypothetical protein [Treponema sp.]